MNPEEKQKQIAVCEKKLLNAFEKKDLAVLDELIHEQAFFVLPNAQTATKPMVLDNYRSGGMAMSSITSSDQKINFIDDAAIVSINLELKGEYQGQQISAQFRYLRVWKLVNGDWKVAATSGVPLNK